MSDRQPTSIVGPEPLSTGELISQLRDRISDLQRAEGMLSKEIHGGIALMLLDEIEKSVAGR